MRLPSYDAVIWFRVPSTPPDLYVRILEKANITPYELTELTGVRDIHWGFSNVPMPLNLPRIFWKGLAQFRGENGGFVSEGLSRCYQADG